jgi:DNA-binding FadR family transcriptional regulator
LYGAETWTFWRVDQKYLESFAMWYSIRMEKISRTDQVRNEEVLQTVEEYMTILQTIQRRKPNCIGHILRRTCFQKNVSEER